MDPSKMPGGSNRHYAGKEDAPPSYSEAMQGQPSPHINYTSTPAPSAPTLESTIRTNVYPKNEPPHFPQTDASHSLAENYLDTQKWDNRAARMLVMNRLQMQEQFDNAKTEAEREVLWNMLLNQLLGYGYNFSVIDLINFWEFQFEIYKSIVKNMQTGASSGTNWEFFEPMNRVFAHYDVSSLADAVPSSSTSILSNSPIPVIVPIPMPLPATGPNQFPGNSEVPLSTIQSNLQVPSVPLNAASGDQITSTLSPPANAANEIPQMNPPLTANGLSPTNFNKEDQQPIMTQPESYSSVPKFIEENNAEPVVTTQPTFTQTMPPETTTANNRRNDDGCCSGDPGCYPIFCFNCHDDYHYHHSHTNDSCCDDGCCCDCGAGGGCCDGDSGGGGCCDGADDTGCCDGADGCDGCDGCNDLDCSGCDGC